MENPKQHRTNAVLVGPHHRALFFQRSERVHFLWGKKGKGVKKMMSQCKALEMALSLSVEPFFRKIRLYDFILKIDSREGKRKKKEREGRERKTPRRNPFVLRTQR